MAARELDDTDFLAWTEQQAALRQMFLPALRIVLDPASRCRAGHGLRPHAAATPGQNGNRMSMIC